MTEIDTENSEVTINVKPVKRDRWHLTVKDSRGEVLRTETDPNPKKLARLGRTTHGGTHVEVTEADPHKSSS